MQGRLEECKKHIRNSWRAIDSLGHIRSAAAYNDEELMDAYSNHIKVIEEALCTENLSLTSLEHSVLQLEEIRAYEDFVDSVKKISIAKFKGIDPRRETEYVEEASRVGKKLALASERLVQIFPCLQDME